MPSGSRRRIKRADETGAAALSWAPFESRAGHAGSRKRMSPGRISAGRVPCGAMQQWPAALWFRVGVFLGVLFGAALLGG